MTEHRDAYARLDAATKGLTHFTAGLHPPGEDVTATVSGALSRTASNLMSHVAAV